MQNTLTFNIVAIPENAELISKINKLIIDNLGAPKALDPATKMLKEVLNGELLSHEELENRILNPTKTDEPAKTDEPVKDSQAEYKAFVDAAAEARKVHGVDFLKEVLKAHGAKIKQSVPKTLSAVHPSKHEVIMKDWLEGPKSSTVEDDGFDDDGFDDEKDTPKDTPKVDPEAVRIALKAYSRTHGRDKAKEIMKKHGVTNLSKIEDASQKALAEILKEVA